MSDYQMVHLRLPLALIKELDSVVSKVGASRNEVVTEAVARYLSGMLMAEKIRRAYGSLDAKDAPEWAEDSVDWVRRIRDEEDRRIRNGLPD